VMIETQPYSVFSRAVHDEVNPLRIPVNGTIEITNRCPLECAHCYNNLPMNDAGARRRELSTEEHKRLLDELADLGCLWLLYSGGEIFARADFLEIYSYARSKGFLITLFTNATLITERVADFLAANPPFDIEVTLYGRTKATYESLTGIPGSFEKCIRGIHLLLERKLPLKLKTVALTINKHELKAMRQFAEELGVEFKFDPMINPRIDCSSSPLAVRLSPADIVTLDLDDEERVSEWRRLAVHCAPPVLAEGETRMLYECGGGVNSFAVDPYGDMTICVLSHFDKYNVRDGSVRDGWNHFLLSVRTRKVTRVTKCTHCALKSLCGSCAANGELENGDPEAPVDFLCRTAHLRAEVFGVNVPAHGDCEYCVDGSERHVIDELVEKVHSRHGDVAMMIADVPAAAAREACGSGGCGSCHVR
ncbi:MAG TPA: radical SAM protein, partial [Thermoanaerobaculia bacterium]|nr:radical SAM protein [Thermoanaerobaculia bacterium]